MGASDFVYRISHYECFCGFGHGFDTLLLYVWVEWCSGIAMAYGYGERQGRLYTMRSIYIPLVALQLLFSRFISFRVILSFFVCASIFVYVHIATFPLQVYIE